MPSSRLPQRPSGRRRHLTRLGAGLAGGLLLLGAGACSAENGGATAADAYKIGCPAVDSAMGGGSFVNKATVSALEALRDSRQLGDEAQSWLESAITAVKSGKPSDLPADVRATIVNGCAENGYRLQNLR